MELSLRDSLASRPDVVFRRLDEEAVLLDLKSGKYFGLNEVGAMQAAFSSAASLESDLFWGKVSIEGARVI